MNPSEIIALVEKLLPVDEKSAARAVVFFEALRSLEQKSKKLTLCLELEKLFERAIDLGFENMEARVSSLEMLCELKFLDKDKKPCKISYEANALIGDMRQPLLAWARFEDGYAVLPSVSLRLAGRKIGERLLDEEAYAHWLALREASLIEQDAALPSKKSAPPRI